MWGSRPGVRGQVKGQIRGHTRGQGICVTSIPGEEVGEPIMMRDLGFGACLDFGLFVLLVCLCVLSCLYLYISVSDTWGTLTIEYLYCLFLMKNYTYACNVIDPNIGIFFLLYFPNLENQRRR